jgi:hypothetical protein
VTGQGQASVQQLRVSVQHCSTQAEADTEAGATGAERSDAATARNTAHFIKPK